MMPKLTAIATKANTEKLAPFKSPFLKEFIYNPPKEIEIFKETTVKPLKSPLTFVDYENIEKYEKNENTSSAIAKANDY